MSYLASAGPDRSGEQLATVGELELCYETFGDRSDPALVLIMGLATQMIAWREEFCEGLAARGFFVVRFDNRDVGRSSRLDHLPVPTVWQLLRRDKAPRATRSRTWPTMSSGSSTTSAIERAHVVGASMGVDDRPDAGGHASRPRQLARLDHGQHRRAHVRTADPAHLEGAPGRPAGGPRRLRRAHGEDVHADRLARLRARRGRAAGARADVVRSRPQPGRRRAPARRDPRLRRPHEAPARDHGAHARHPRQRPTSSSARPAAVRPPRRSTARSCSRSPAWATTSRAGPGRRSSTRSSRTPRGRSQRVSHESGRLASVAIGSGRRSSTRSASVTCSSTSRTLVRSAIQTSRSLAAEPS